VTGARTDSARAVFLGALPRLDPAARVRAALAADEPVGAAIVLAVGKAACAMSAGAAAHLGGALVGGLVVAPAPGEVPPPLSLLVAAHPRPDARSAAAGAALLAAARAVPAGARLYALVSGGASALAVAPAAGVPLDAKIDALARLAAAGAPIAELNCVRKHLSALKGGQLAAACPAPVTTLIASDVVGDPLDAVGSGPTVPDPTTFSDACAVIERHLGWDAVAPAVRSRLRAGVAGAVAETPSRRRPGDRAVLVAGVGALVDAAVETALAAGLEAEVIDRAVTGDVAAVAARIVRVARLVRDGRPGRRLCLISGGEPTVAIPPAPGVGGRAQQLALLCARALRGVDRVAVLAAGSDGIDGASDAAGAVIDGGTWDAIAAAGVDPAAALAGCDAGTALAAVGATIVTGPTGVNHADLIVVRVDT
jgi:glycerate 2-kinase